MPALHPLVDIGANLGGKSFEGDLDAVLARARAAGVVDIVVTGTSVADAHAAADLAARHHLSSTAGIHPHHARDATEEAMAQLRALCDRPEVVAVGECGLDYFRDLAPRADQRAAFEAHLRLAEEVGKPLFLHERDAHIDFLEVVRQHRSKLGAVVVHCFTGTRAELEAYLALDLHIGITGWICDERRGLHLRELVGLVPRNRLMIETDAPYLLPRTISPAPRDRRNEPAYLPYVLETLASALGRSAAEVAHDTTATARAFFKLGA